jgi:hypothetical protein
MTAKIIDFRVHHQLKSARPKGAALRPAGKASLDQQVARIGYFLRELEDTARGSEALPQVLVAQAHTSIERTRTMLQSWPVVRTSGKPDATGEDADQPHIDPALLERMYSDLGLYP